MAVGSVKKDPKKIPKHKSFNVIIHHFKNYKIDFDISLKILTKKQNAYLTTK